MKDHSFPQFISLRQASKISGYHPDYLSQLIRKGKIRAIRIGRNWFVPEQEIKNFSSDKASYFPYLLLKLGLLFALILAVAILVISIFIFREISIKKENIFINQPQIPTTEENSY